MKEKLSNNISKKNNAEYAKEVDACALAWNIFKETSDVNYYHFYSALKDADKTKNKTKNKRLKS